MKPSEILKCARELLKDRKAWAQEALAYDANKCPVSPEAPEAVSWCILGAIRKCEGNYSPWEARNYISRAIGYQNIEDFNDRKNRSHKTILAKLAQAQALAEEDGQ